MTYRSLNFTFLLLTGIGIAAFGPAGCAEGGGEEEDNDGAGGTIIISGTQGNGGDVATGPGMGGATATDSATTTDAVTDAATSSAAITSNAVTTSQASIVSSSSGSSQCDNGSCDNCANCAINSICVNEYLNCALDIGCADFALCAQNCGMNQSCIQACANQYPTGYAVFQLLEKCISCACVNTCQGSC